jgi:hypothetical protein
MASISGKSARPSSALGNALAALGIIAGVIAAIAVIQSLPIFSLKPLGAQAYANDNVLVYYERGDEAGAKEVFDLVSSNIGRIDERMKYRRSSPQEIFVYKDQSSLWMRKYGLVTLLFAPSWYVGDNRGNAVLMVSPNAPVGGHTHDTIIGATLHEVVHTVNYEKNPKLSYFWDNGLATYITGQTPPGDFLSPASMPSLEQTHTENEMEFGNMGGYGYSYSYIEYLDKTYGWDRVINFASGGKTYEQVFGVSEQEIYDGWGEYLRR